MCKKAILHAAYPQRICALKYREVLVTCRQSAKELAGDEWTLGEITGPSVQYFWTCAKTDTKGMMDIITLLGISVSTARGGYGLSWGSACGGSIGVSTRSTRSMFEMIL